jgi:hypothetical protein
MKLFFPRKKRIKPVATHGHSTSRDRNGRKRQKSSGHLLLYGDDQNQRWFKSVSNTLANACGVFSPDTGPQWKGKTVQKVVDDENLTYFIII